MSCRIIVTGIVTGIVIGKSGEPHTKWEFVVQLPKYCRVHLFDAYDNRHPTIRWSSPTH